MRTTVDLPDPLFRQMKAVAALRGATVKEFILGAVRQELMAKGSRDRKTVEPPLIRSKRPGTLALTNAQIEDLLA